MNDQRVVMPVVLEPGARIRVADNTLTFMEEEAVDEDMDVTVAVTSTGGAGMLSRPVALLVCDIRGFSTMSERIPSAELAQLLGKWFREASNAVQRGYGTIDKFIGDALLAYWAGTAGCDTVFEIARDLLKLAEDRAWPGGDAFKIAIALHYGAATFSDMGMASGRDATIIGDAVNTVFRLEALSKELDRPVVLSSAFTGQLTRPPAMKDFGDRVLKGKSQAVRVFALDE